MRGLATNGLRLVVFADGDEVYCCFLLGLEIDLPAMFSFGRVRDEPRAS